MFIYSFFPDFALYILLLFLQNVIKLSYAHFEVFPPRLHLPHLEGIP